MMGNDDFRQALSDFSFDVASGGAIRHLTDLGYTVRQIQERLDFPTPLTRIREAVWKRLTDTGVILLEEPLKGLSADAPAADTGRGIKVNYIREYDSYGKASFRRVEEKTGDQEADEQVAGQTFLTCRFGQLKSKDPKRYQKVLGALEGRQAEYIDGLPWPEAQVWHRADGRMLAIWKRLRDAGLDQGVCERIEA